MGLIVIPVSICLASEVALQLGWDGPRRWLEVCSEHPWRCALATLLFAHALRRPYAAMPERA